MITDGLRLILDSDIVDYSDEGSIEASRHPFLPYEPANEEGNWLIPGSWVPLSFGLGHISDPVIVDAANGPCFPVSTELTSMIELNDKRDDSTLD